MAAIALLRQLRERNDQREQQVMQQQERMRQEQMQQQEQMRQEIVRRQENDASGAQRMAESNVPLGDIEKAYPNLTLQGYTLAKITADHKKRQEQEAKAKEQEAPAAATVGAQLPFLAGLIPGGNVNSPEYANLVSGLAQTGLSQDALAPLLQRLSAEVQLSPFASAAAQQGLRAKLDETGQIERLKAGIDVKKQAEIKTNDLILGRLADQRTAADAAKVDLHADQLANAFMRASEDPEGITRTLLSIQGQMDNPAIEMPPVQAKANAIVAASKDARGVADNFAQFGYQVPTSLAQSVVDGKAAIDEYTGLISIDPGKNGAQQRQSRASSMTLITQLKAVAQRMSDGPMRGMNTTERLAWATAQAAKYEIGTADPLYTDYRNRKGPLSFSMARATFTGTMANQERQAMDKLFADPRMISGGRNGGLNPQAESIFASLYANIESQYRVATPRGPFPSDKLRGVLESQKQNDLDFFRKTYLDTQYPTGPNAQGWEPSN